VAPAVFNTVGGNPAVGAVGSTPSRSRQTFVPHSVCSMRLRSLRPRLASKRVWRSRIWARRFYCHTSLVLFRPTSLPTYHWNQAVRTP